MDSLQEYRDSARQAEVPEHIIDWFLRFARPRIVLDPTSQGGGSPVGRYGGLPALPPDVSWDAFRDGDFVASIDCAALPQGALDIPLPRSGNLLFFADKDGGGLDEEIGEIIHVPAGTATVERAPAHADAPYTDPYPLYGRLDWSVPSDASNGLLRDEDIRRVVREYDLHSHVTPNHTSDEQMSLGGYAECVSWNDPSSLFSSEEEPWLLVAQARYAMSFFPKETGCSYWLIRHQDLANMRFENAETVLKAFF